MRALKISAVVLVLLLLVADRVGAVVAASVIATRLQTAGSLSAKPDVSIRGFPFLTQAVSGRYDRIELTAQDVKRRSINLKDFEVTVTGARVPLGEALGGHVASVPVERLTAEALISFVDLASRSRLADTTITVAGREVLVTGTFTLLGQKVVVRTISSVRLEGSSLVLSPRSVDVSLRTPAAIRAATPLLGLRVTLGSLPYGLRLTGVKVTKDGLLLSAKTGPTVLMRP